MFSSRFSAGSYSTRSGNPLSVRMDPLCGADAATTASADTLPKRGSFQICAGVDVRVDAPVGASLRFCADADRAKAERRRFKRERYIDAGNAFDGEVVHDLLPAGLATVEPYRRGLGRSRCESSRQRKRRQNLFIVVASPAT
jgi:hypothetical protein